MDILDVANHDTLHGAPSLSAEKIAEQMSCGYQVLLNKVNWAADANKLTQREALALQHLTGTRNIIQAECRLLGGEFVAHAGEVPADIPGAVLRNAAEHGDVGRAINDALGDGKLTVREEAHISKQIDEAIESLNELRRAVRSRASGVSR